jgi:hypothetical protein
MASAMIPEVSQFLTVSEGRKLACTDKKNNALVRHIDTKLVVKAEKLNETMANIRFETFPKLRELQLKGNDYPAAFICPNGTGRIDHLSVKNQYNLPPNSLNRLIEPFSSVARLTLSNVSVGYLAPPFLAPATHQLSDAARASLNGLKELDLGATSVHPEGVRTLVLGQTQLTSVTLGQGEISDVILRELVLNENLTHLDLISVLGNNVNYEILTNCHGLRSFAPSRGMTEAQLIAILSENPEITHLNLSVCDKSAVTDDVLQTIRTKNPKIQSLQIGNGTITGLELIEFTKACTDLRSLELGSYGRSFGAVSPEDMTTAVSHCQKLVSLNISGEGLTDEFLTMISGKTTLKELSIPSMSSEFSESGIKLLRNLVNLEALNLDQCNRVTDESLKLLIDALPNLKKLRINCWGANLTMDLIHHIKAKLTDGTCHLTYLGVYEAGLPIQEVNAILQKSEANPKGIQLG